MGWGTIAAGFVARTSNMAMAKTKMHRMLRRVSSMDTTPCSANSALSTEPSSDSRPRAAYTLGVGVG